MCPVFTLFTRPIRGEVEAAPSHPKTPFDSAVRGNASDFWLLMVSEELEWSNERKDGRWEGWDGDFE